MQNELDVNSKTVSVKELIEGISIFFIDYICWGRDAIIALLIRLRKLDLGRT